MLPQRGGFRLRIMACYKPLTAYQCADRSIIWRELPGADVVRTLQLPCGQCVGCRLGAHVSGRLDVCMRHKCILVVFYYFDICSRALS